MIVGNPTIAHGVTNRGLTFTRHSDSAASISRYYAKWTPEYQNRQHVLIRKIHVTDLAQAREQAVKR